MKLNDLLQKSNWEEVEKYLLTYYAFTDEEPELKPPVPREEYKKVYDSLFALGVEECQMQIEIEYDTYEDDETIYPRVYGTDGTLNEESGLLQRYDLTAHSWSSWLGMGISAKVLQTISVNEIVALCLYEMTMFGMDEQTIADFWDTI
jgi:hypothetical protein